jgi:hypothetical protein
MGVGGAPRESDLADLRDLVKTLESSLASRGFKEGRVTANQLVNTTTRWIGRADADQSIDPELGAALQVFRNAAFAFRKLARSNAEAREQLASACATLLAQGSDLLNIYSSGELES